MPGGLAAGISGVAQVVGGLKANDAQGDAASAAARAQTQAANQANATQLAVYTDQRSLAAPGIQAGAEARARQMLMQGYTPAEVRAYLEQTNSAINSPSAQILGMSDADALAAYPGAADDYRAMQHDGIPGNAASSTPADLARSRLRANPSLLPNSSSTTTSAPLDTSWVDNYNWQSSSPSYESRYQEGRRAVNARDAANGRYYSGANDQALTRYGQDYASREFEADFGRFGELAGDGARSTTTAVNAAGNYGDAVSQNQINAGNARASSYLASGNAQSQLWGNTIPGAIGSFVGYGAKNGWFGA